MTVDGHREAPGDLGKLLGVRFPQAKDLRQRTSLGSSLIHAQKSWSPGYTFISPKHKCGSRGVLDLKETVRRH